MLTKLHSEDHRTLIHRLRDQAEEWLQAKGIDQYQIAHFAQKAHDDIDAKFDRGEFVGLDVDGDIKAVTALTSHDPDFWTEREMAEPTVYISRFLVAEHGHGYGGRLLEDVAAREAARGKRSIRLDCWKTNTQLHAYYLARGFRHVRTEHVAGRMSGALFERNIDAEAPEVPSQRGGACTRLPA